MGFPKKIKKTISRRIKRTIRTMYNWATEVGTPAPGNNLQNTSQKKDTFKNDIKFNASNADRFDMDTKCTMTAQMFYGKIGYYPDIKNPKTFSEKVLWYKLFYQDDRIPLCCDKYNVKAYIDDVIGEGHVVPVLKKYDNVSAIDLSELPEKFVLKVSWCTGYNIIVTDKSEIDIEEIKATLDYWTLPWKSSYYGSFNWGYKDLRPIIFAEEYIDIPNYSTEYKMFCFNGKVRFTLVELDYFGKNPQRAYYDRNWKEEKFQISKIKKVQTEKPETYEKMLEIAERLAEPFPLVRVDFYDIAGKLYVGEMTFYSGGGFSDIIPTAYDAILGIDLDMTEAMEKMNYTVRQD